MLTARFAAVSYKITYNLDGGKIGSKPTSYTFGAGSSKAVPDPKKDGAEFAGWTARVTNNGVTKVYTKENADPNLDISKVIDPDTKKIKTASQICGNIELVADWTPYTYDIRFVKDDGSLYSPEGNALSDYLGLKYSASIDLTAAAMYLEGLEGFDQSKSIKGFALASAATSPKYALYKSYSKLGAKAGNGTELRLYPVLTGKIERINYSIILMPNAGDVKTSDDAEGFIDNANGVQYVVKGAGDVEITEFAYNTTAAFNAPEWKRTGYELVGFGTSAKSKVPINSISKLGSGKQSVVKLYAIWKGKVNIIHYTKYVHVYEPYQGYEFKVEPSFAGTTTQVYNGKDVTLKTVSLKGYVFKGWMFETAKGGVIRTYPAIDMGPVKKVLKNNDADLYLSAYFGRVWYTVNFDPNGGTYDGSSKKGIDHIVAYSNDVSDIMEEFYKGVSRKGYVISGLSTTKNGRNRIELYDTDGKRMTVSGLSEKDGAKVTIYPIWKKVTPAVPSASASLSPQTEAGKYTLKMTSSLAVTDENTKLIFEYSASPLFIFGVKTAELTVDPDNPESVSSVTVSGLKNRTYYVRVRYGRKDSAGEFVYGKNSKTVTANRSVR